MTFEQRCEIGKRVHVATRGKSAPGRVNSQDKEEQGGWKVWSRREELSDVFRGVGGKLCHVSSDVL